MTEVGRMIYEEGIEKGKEMLIKQLIKKFKIVPDEYKKKIMALPQDVIEVIGTEIFDINSLDELKKYFSFICYKTNNCNLQLIRSYCYSFLLIPANIKEMHIVFYLFLP